MPLRPAGKYFEGLNWFLDLSACDAEWLFIRRASISVDLDLAVYYSDRQIKTQVLKVIYTLALPHSKRYFYLFSCKFLLPAWAEW